MNYSTDITSCIDYYPYGMLMPGRFGSQNTSNYRYGFNGMEKDDEVKGSGNSYTTEFRQYGSRLGRWLSLDPVTHHHFSPYSAFDNNPVYFADASGADSEKGDGDPSKNGGNLEELTVTSSGSKNTTKGSVEFSYAPISYSQVGGNVQWKQQNDLAYLRLNPANRPNPHGWIDETSAIWQINFYNKNLVQNKNLSLDLKAGLGYARIKGGIHADGPANVEQPHFGHGLGNIGSNIKIQGVSSLTKGKGIDISASLGLTNGFSISAFDTKDGTRRYSQGIVNLSALDSSEPSWSNRGFGATAYGEVNLSIGSALLKKQNSKNLFKLNIGATFAIHSVSLNPYENLDTGRKYSRSNIVTAGVGGHVGFTVDFGGNR